MKTNNHLLKHLPSVDAVLQQINLPKYTLPYPAILRIIRDELKAIRSDLHPDHPANDVQDMCLRRIRNRLKTHSSPSFRRILNGTGIVLHTGMGRAPVSRKVWKDTSTMLTGYNNIELDIHTGKRGERLLHTELLINALTGSQQSVVVNNNAAAVLLMLNTLAENREVIISRGQQVEIGGSFRIPDVIRKSGCIMVEVGTTNKTHLSDYETAITPATGAILVAHTSNFRVEGFTEDVPVKELGDLARRKRIPLIVDLGSGALSDLDYLGLPAEPMASQYLRDGAHVICFSGDKLLGGPQAGIICGKRTLVKRIRRNALYRALRCDKTIHALLEQTLRTYHSPKDFSPDNLSLFLLTRDRSKLMIIGEAIISRLRLSDGFTVSIVPTEVEAGSGSLPTEKIASAALHIRSRHHRPSRLAAAFRDQDPPVIGYVTTNSFYIDLKAILPEEEEILAAALQRVLG